MLKAAIAHKGTVMLDVVSPCVTFNDHEGSTKSYKYMKDHEEPMQDISFVPAFEDITVDYDPGTTIEVTMHDGSQLCACASSKKTTIPPIRSASHSAADTKPTKKAKS